jgi:hypothetical protein
MGIVNFGRLLFLIIAAVLTLIAIALGITAVVTPSWQVVYISEFQTEHQHGLWMDCTRGKKHVEGIAEDSLHCTYKFDGAMEHDNDHSHGSTNGDRRSGGEQQHKFFAWHKAVLVLCIAAIISGFIALCFSFCSPCEKICAIVFNVFLLISSLLSIGAMAIFFINSHKVDFRFVHGVASTYEQSRGYSFWLEVSSTITFIAAFIISIAGTVLLFAHDRHLHQPIKTWPKANNTSV